jgi:hypothetical protein
MIPKPNQSFVSKGHLSHCSEVLSMSYHQHISVFRLR